MSSATPAAGASEALARFIANSHAGATADTNGAAQRAEADDALRIARARLADARSALQTRSDVFELASRALASYGTPFRRAFTTATKLATTFGAPADAPIVAAAMVSSELAGRGDENIVEAIAIGREVAALLQRALRLDAPWDAAAVVAGIGAAAAAARAAALDVETARNAIGLAATQAAGLGVTEGTPAAALGSGKAAADAVEAALLARHGFTSAPASLEGRRGLAALMATHFDEAALCDGLGSSTPNSGLRGPSR